MSIQNFFNSLTSAFAGRRPVRQRRAVSRPQFESLEERFLLTFSPPVDYGADLSPQALVSADFNGDGRLDLAVGNHDDFTVSVLLGNGDGTFQAPRTSVAGNGPPQLVAGDLNADGKADLVTVGIWNYPSMLNVLLSNGDGTFQPPQAITLPAQVIPGYPDSEPLVQGAISAAIGDFDGDGTLDVIAGGQVGWIEYVYYNELDPPELVWHVYSYANVQLGNGDGTFRVSDVKPISGHPLVHAGDFNHDARLDVLSSGGALLGNGDGTLQDPLRSDIHLGYVPNPVGDFNGDGNLDVLYHYHILPQLLLGNGDGTFRQGPSIDTNGYGSSVVSDVNADGKLDILEATSVFSLSGPDPFVDGVTTLVARVLLGNGDGSFAPPISVDLGTLPGTSAFTTVLADFDGNGFPDLAVSEENWATQYDEAPSYRGVYVMLNDGSWTAAPPIPPAITIGDVTVTGGNTGTRAASFTVTLSKAWSQPVTVAYTTANGTAAGSDFQASSGTLAIPAGQTTGTITVLVKGDRLGEANETFLVNLSNSTNATLGDAQAVGTIVDEEPRISISDVSKAEGKKGQTTLFTFTVTLSAAYDQAVTMSYQTVNGTAKTSDSDYVAKSGTLTFAPGQTSKTITIEVKGDSKRESNETFYLDLSGLSSNASFIKNRGIGTILNDD